MISKKNEGTRFQFGRFDFNSLFLWNVSLDSLIGKHVDGLEWQGCNRTEQKNMTLFSSLIDAIPVLLEVAW